MKHVEIFRKAPLDDIIIAFEDDAILVDNFKNKLEMYLNDLNNYEWDVVFTAECSDHHYPNIQDNKLFYGYLDSGSRGTCMYILNKGACRKYYELYNNENNIDVPIDFWFNKK